MPAVKNRVAGFVKHVAWLLKQERRLDSCYWAQDVAMAVGVIAEVSNNEGVNFEADESFIGTSFLVGLYTEDDKRESLVDWLEEESTKRQKEQEI